MKRFFIAGIIAALCCSCSTLKPMPRGCITMFSDYREYAQEGFLISPGSYTYDFDSVGEINIVVTPALEQTKIIKLGETTNKGLKYESISSDELVKMAVEEAKSKGADALVNFSIELEEITARDVVMGGYTKGYRYYVKGYCIKRK